MKYDVVLLEKPDTDGLTRAECQALFDRIKTDEVYPIEIPNLNRTNVAMGIISTEAANKLDYEYSRLNRFIGHILEDMNLESSNGEYSFEGLDIYMSR